MTSNQEPRDIESRLRASLNAYAEVVDDQPARRSPMSGSRSRPTSLRARGWRAPVLVAAAVLAVAGGAWLLVDDPAAPSPTAAADSTTGDSGAEAATAAGAPSAEEAADAPTSAGDVVAAAVGPAGDLIVLPPAAVGVTYPFDLYTHCGIFGADVAGVWFAVDAPLVEDYSPPEGWGNPYQRGTVILTSADEATFRDDVGHELRLHAAPESERPPPCD